MTNVNGYLACYMPNHHRATSSGMVYEHILVAEQKIGRLLKPDEVVHHIDGKRNNNSLNNLLIFRSKADHTSFHHGKNFLLDNEGIAYVPNKNNYYCVDCGKEISKNATRCIECANKQQQKVNRPSREELKELIRKFPFTQIGTKFSVSDNTIRKWCKSYNLPTKKCIINSINDISWIEI